MLATILISLVLAAIVALILRQLIHDKKQGKSSCGGSCGSCGGCNGCSACHSTQAR